MCSLTIFSLAAAAVDARSCILLLTLTTALMLFETNPVTAKKVLKLSTAQDILVRCTAVSCPSPLALSSTSCLINHPRNPRPGEGVGEEQVDESGGYNFIIFTREPLDCHHRTQPTYFAPIARERSAMKPSTSLIGLASVAAFLIPGTHGFVVPGNMPGGVISKTHDVSSSCRGNRPVFPTRYASRRCRDEPSSLLMMAAGKKRRRRKGDQSGASVAASGVSTASKPKQPADPAGGGAGQLGDVLEGDRGVEELFTDDWSDMPANTGMVKSNVSPLCHSLVGHGAAWEMRLLLCRILLVYILALALGRRVQTTDICLPITASSGLLSTRFHLPLYRKLLK